jgi:hypothetical protein
MKTEMGSRCDVELVDDAASEGEGVEEEEVKKQCEEDDRRMKPKGPAGSNRD